MVEPVLPCLVPALRQYMHNDGSGFVCAYDMKQTNQVVNELSVQIQRQHEAHRRTWRQLEQTQLELAALKGGQANG